MTSAASATQFDTDDRNHLDTLLTQQSVGEPIAVVGVDHARRRAHQVGAVVPLRALAHVGVAASLDYPHRLDSEGLSHHVRERLVVLVEFNPAWLVAGR